MSKGRGSSGVESESLRNMLTVLANMRLRNFAELVESLFEREGIALPDGE